MKKTSQNKDDVKKHLKPSSPKITDQSKKGDDSEGIDDLIKMTETLTMRKSPISITSCLDKMGNEKSITEKSIRNQSSDVESQNKRRKQSTGIY